MRIRIISLLFFLPYAYITLTLTHTQDTHTRIHREKQSKTVSPKLAEIEEKRISHFTFCPSGLFKFVSAVHIIFIIRKNKIQRMLDKYLTGIRRPMT